MAITTDQLESISNADLREQCKVFGLPNVPVTDTSRKVLIRKLKMAMEASASGEKEKSKRRETIHVTKKMAPEPEPVKKVESTRSSRRTTIAATRSSTEPEAPVAKVERRRSSRYSSTSSEKGSEKKSTEIPSKRKTPIFEEDSEDDLILVKAVEKADKTQKQLTELDAKKFSTLQETKDRRSRSKSLQLQKSPTVTLSYEKVPSTVHETEESETDNEISTQNVHNYNTTKPFVPIVTERQSLYNLPRATPPLAPPTNRYSAAVAANTFNKATDFTSAAVSSGLGSSNLARSRYTTGTTYKYEDDVENNGEGEVEIGGRTTPYYSDFARRLERIKNEQLNMSGKSVRERDISYKRDIPVSRPYDRRKLHDQETDVFRTFFINLDQKYNIKQKLFIILVTFLLIIVYVVLFH